MKFCVLITGIFPPDLAALAIDESAAAACADHVRAMFPLLCDGGFVEIAPVGDWRCSESMPARGHLRDCLQAYILTGNGAPRPAPGTVALP